jgi:hypothetical protein
MEGHSDHHNIILRYIYTVEASQQDYRGAQRYFFFTYGGTSTLPSQDPQETNATLIWALHHHKGCE